MIVEILTRLEPVTKTHREIDTITLVPFANYFYTKYYVLNQWLFKKN